ncbi:MAG: hypothetical protein R2711_18645 [Acidimicrobiales bacterium]
MVRAELARAEPSRLVVAVRAALLVVDGAAAAAAATALLAAALVAWAWGTSPVPLAVAVALAAVGVGAPAFVAVRSHRLGRRSPTPTRCSSRPATSWPGPPAVPSWAASRRLRGRGAGGRRRRPVGSVGSAGFAG